MGRKWLHLAAGLAGVVYLGWLGWIFVRQVTAPLDAQRLRSATEQLDSYEAEGRVLDRAKGHRAPRTYTRWYAQHLAELAQGVEQELRDSRREPGVREQAGEAARRAGRIYDELERLENETRS